MENEIWKTINGFNYYKISNLGQVKNIRTNKILKLSINKGGYLGLGLKNNNNKTQQKRIHRILGESLIENPFNLPLIDHIDNDRLNNNLSNLRWVDYTENCMNTRKRISNTSSQYKGVYKTKSNKWCASIRLNYKKIHIGTFATEDEAGNAYNKYATEIYETFACLNVIN